MATQPSSNKVSFAEYLELERRAPTKSEYRSGEIFAMSGGTPVHARLSAMLCHLLIQTRGSRCNVYSSDLKIYAAAVNEGMYPDVSMLCGEPEFVDGRQDVILNPTLVAEVLSPSTREYDQSLKASFYRTIPSLQTILLIDSQRQYVQRQTRQAKNWMLDEFTSSDGVLWIEGSRSVTLGDLYEGIKL